MSDSLRLLNTLLKLANQKLLPFDEKDIIVGFSHRIPLFIGLDGIIKKLGKEKRPQTISERFSPSAITPWPMNMVASNVFAISPPRSDDGYTRLMINTHQPWTGPVAWYEAHLVSEEGWDFYGAVFPGSPVPLIGHNLDLGWSHTVNSPDLVDVYKLTINEDIDNLPTLKNDTNDIIIYKNDVEEFKEKSKKRFWEKLISNE